MITENPEDIIKNKTHSLYLKPSSYNAGEEDAPQYNKTTYKNKTSARHQESRLTARAQTISGLTSYNILYMEKFLISYTTYIPFTPLEALTIRSSY